MKLSFIFIFGLFLISNLFAYDGFDSSEFLISYNNQLTQFAPGHMGERMSVSNDAKKMVFSEYSNDIKNNLLYTVDLETKKVSLLKSPYGYKNHPIFVGDKIFITLASKKSYEGYVDGIYYFDTIFPEKGWIIWEEGSFRDLATDNNNRFIAYSTGNWNTAAVKSSLFVQPIGPDSKKTSSSYRIASNFSGQTYNIAFSKDAGIVYFSGDTESQGQGSVYKTPNSAGKSYELLIPNASDQSVYKGSESKETVLMFLRDFTVYLYFPDREEERKLLSSKYSNYVGVPTFGAENIIYFRIQQYPGKAALFETTVNIEDYF